MSGTAPCAALLTFGEALLTYKAPPVPAPQGVPGASTVIQAIGGSELNVAVALAQLGSPSASAAWVSVLPTGPLGDLVVNTANAVGVDTSTVVRMPDSDIGTLHVVDDGTGPRPHYQRHRSAFCLRMNSETFAWARLLDGKPQWLFLTGITPLLGAGARAEWCAALDALATLAAPPHVCLDLNHRPALGSLDELWAVVRPHVRKLTLLMLSEDSLEAIARRESCWPSQDASSPAAAEDARYLSQRSALSALRAKLQTPARGVLSAAGSSVCDTPSPAVARSVSRTLSPPSSIHEALHAAGIVPVVTLDEASHAVPVASALAAGGVKVIELTLRTPVAEECMKLISEAVPQILVGAGTVLSTAQAERALACGAQFLVAPGTNPKLVRWAASRGVAILPGVATASEVETAMELGLTHLKFFPAEALGGLATLKALSAPYRAVKWMPTGGLTPLNATDYLKHPSVLCVGGSWLTPPDVLKRAAYDEVRALAHAAVRTASEARPLPSTTKEGR